MYVARNLAKKLPTLQAALPNISVSSCKHNSSWVATVVCYISACTNETHSLANLHGASFPT